MGLSIILLWKKLNNKISEVCFKKIILRGIREFYQMERQICKIVEKNKIIKYLKI